MTPTTNSLPVSPAARPAMKPCSLGRVIATGGEGEIRECVSQPDLVAKIFQGCIPEELDLKERKIRAMLRLDSLRGHSRLKWPVSVVHMRGRFAGYLMPRAVGSITLVPLSAEVSRKRYLPHWTPAHVARVAHDISAICAHLEKENVFVVDTSLTNFLTDPQGATCLIDTDSLQISGSSGHFSSKVFTPEYAAPETLTQRNRLANIGPEQARFTAAMLLFQIFTHGSPYQVLANRDLEPSQQIVGGRTFLGGSGVATGMTTPDIYARYRQLPPRIAWLFKRAFIEGHSNPAVRPTFQEWVNATIDYYNSLRSGALG